MSELGALRITLGVVGASGNRELVLAVVIIDDDADNFISFVTFRVGEGTHAMAAEPAVGRVMVATILFGVITEL